MLVDNALSPVLVQELVHAGCKAVHVRERGLAAADDTTILQQAREEQRIVVSRDGDFATLLALGNATTPSFVHLRIPGINQPADQAELLLRALDAAAAELVAGAIVTVSGGSIRIRALPVHQR